MRAHIEAYIQKVLKMYAETSATITPDMTDRVFLLIEDSKELLGAYKNLLACEISRRRLNSLLGRRIREHWSLKNIGRCNNPNSQLIKSYERHSR